MYLISGRSVASILLFTGDFKTYSKLPCSILFAIYVIQFAFALINSSGSYAKNGENDLRART